MTDTIESAPPLLRRDVREARETHALLARRRLARDIILLVLTCAVVSFTANTFLLRSFYIPSESMQPTLDIQDRILVDQITPAIGGYERGDIVVFDDAKGWMTGGQANAEEYLVKRVVGLPGDTVEGLADGSLLVNGKPYSDPRAHESDQEPFQVTVPDGELWVMGDNRAHSADSRLNGTVPIDDVVGRAFWVYWPLSRFGAP